MSQVSWTKKHIFAKNETKVANNVKTEKLADTAENRAKLKEEASKDGVPSALVQMGNDVMLLSSDALVTASKKAQTKLPQIDKGDKINVDGQEAKVLETDDGFSEIDASDVTVAVLDSGLDVNHPAFDGRIVDPYNTLTKTNDVTDYMGHGTHVAGIACGDSFKSGTTIGVAPQAKIMPVKVLQDDGKLRSLEDVIAGIRYAADHGAKVINMSLGASEEALAKYDQTKYLPELQEAIKYAESKGCLVVAAAGNERTKTPSYPASFEGVLSVGAIDNLIPRKAPFSNYGPTIDVTAPGTGITSSWIGGGFKSESGTSMSAPYASGAAALVFAAHPDWTPEQVTSQLQWAVTDMGKAGKDDNFGYGKIDLFKTAYGNYNTPNE